MTSQPTQALFLRDGEGNYYAIPCDTLERYRLPDEQQATIEARFAGDTEGFIRISPASSVPIDPPRQPRLLVEFVGIGILPCELSDVRW